MASAVFFLVALVTLSSGIGVTVARNPIYSALCLVTCMLSLALHFAQLDAHFLAAAQVVVYVGAIMVLVLFVLMLLNVKAEAFSMMDVMIRGAAIVGAGVFACAAIPALRSLIISYVSKVPAAEITTNLPVKGTAAGIGEILYTRYLLTFEAASVLIMVALAGTMLVASRRQQLTVGDVTPAPHK